MKKEEGEVGKGNFMLVKPSPYLPNLMGEAPDTDVAVLSADTMSKKRSACAAAWL
jgi:hypothetical protein